MTDAPKPGPPDYEHSDFPGELPKPGPPERAWVELAADAIRQVTCGDVLLVDWLRANVVRADVHERVVAENCGLRDLIDAVALAAGASPDEPLRQVVNELRERYRAAAEENARLRAALQVDLAQRKLHDTTREELRHRDTDGARMQEEVIALRAQLAAVTERVQKLHEDYGLGSPAGDERDYAAMASEFVFDFDARDETLRHFTERWLRDKLGGSDAALCREVRAQGRREGLEEAVRLSESAGGAGEIIAHEIRALIAQPPKPAPCECCGGVWKHIGVCGNDKSPKPAEPTSRCTWPLPPCADADCPTHGKVVYVADDPRHPRPKPAECICPPFVPSDKWSSVPNPFCPVHGKPAAKPTP